MVVKQNENQGSFRASSRAPAAETGNNSNRAEVQRIPPKQGKHAKAMELFNKITAEHRTIKQFCGKSYGRDRPLLRDIVNAQARSVGSVGQMNPHLPRCQLKIAREPPIDEDITLRHDSTSSSDYSATGDFEFEFPRVATAQPDFKFEKERQDGTRQLLETVEPRKQTKASEAPDVNVDMDDNRDSDREHCTFCGADKHYSADCDRFSTAKERQAKIKKDHRCVQCLESDAHVFCSKAFHICVKCCYGDKLVYHHPLVCKKYDVANKKKKTGKTSGALRKSAFKMEH